MNRLLKKKPAVAAETNGAILSLRGVTRTYPTAQGGLTVLKGVDLDVYPGELVGLIGPSGSGKSSLLHAAGLLEKPTSGTVAIDGEQVGDLDERARTRLRLGRIGFVYQFHHLLPEFSALENVVLPQLADGCPRREAVDRAEGLLDRVGVRPRAAHRPAALSGGEQQRVAFCRALANRPRLLLADEPTGNLDPETSSLVFDTLIGLVRETGLATLIATHNLDLAARMDRVVRLEAGRLV